MRRHRGARAGTITAAVVGLLLSGCTTEPAQPTEVAPQLKVPGDRTTVLAGDDAALLAVSTSEALYDSAPVVVLAADGDVAGQARGASLAVALGVPLLVTPSAGDGAAVRAELKRLDPRAVLTVGNAVTWANDLDDGASVVEAPADPGVLERLTGKRLGAPRPVDPARLVAEVAALDRDRPALLTSGPSAARADDRSPDPGRLPSVSAAAGVGSVLVLVPPAPGALAVSATARASGAQVQVVAGADPRGDQAAIAALSQRRPDRVVAVGAGFGSPELLRRRLEVAATGAQLPGGGQLVFPGRRMVALYGHPGVPAMGVLGEQSVDAAVARARQLARSYEPLVTEPVVPAFEIIATIADTAAGPDGDYSAEATVAELEPWVDAARDAGVYVVLDLQPGRSDFLAQARRYEELLAQPHVGLALDPEWRLAPGQRHREQIGSVTAAEVNTVIGWLADLTRDRRLPQKLLMLHQFRLTMISDRKLVDTSRDELAVLVHADGFGTPDRKFETWNSLRAEPPPGVWWGWKNFYDEDEPTFTPAQTVAITPAPPVFVSYQ
ncbi:hypothetical protein [Pseudonocardia sp. H11422]|uniref:hypothetical protein n=1 Tax=Pseudonocardia sp. H11422 TaxID=2835866 RepID=UPI001BDD0AFC|nr:hypothetical protein [Pseudonocardia sp. H11422]